MGLGFRGLGFRGLGFRDLNSWYPRLIMENQMEKKIENEMDTGII